MIISCSRTFFKNIFNTFLVFSYKISLLIVFKDFFCWFFLFFVIFFLFLHFWDVFGFSSKLLRLPKGKKALVEGQRPPPELEEGPRSGAVIDDCIGDYSKL